MSQLLCRGAAIVAITLAIFFAEGSAEAGHCYNGVCSTSSPTVWTNCSPVYQNCQPRACYQYCYPVEVRVKDWHKRCNYRRIQVKYKQTRHGLVVEYDFDD
jgi:hypothetical protein